MRARLSMAACVLAWSAAAAHAQIVPLHFGTTNRVADEFGALLQGTHPAASSFGQAVVTGALVQILRADSGVFPPDTNGAPHASNPILALSRIGAGVDPALPESGKFAGSVIIPDRYMGATPKVIARVFNKPDLEASSFYADSQLYTVPAFGANYGVFMANVTATTQELDSTDWDGDGLSRSWEKSHGADPDNPDTDGDGLADGPEIRAGTIVTNAASRLAMVQLLPRPPADLDLKWDTVVGKSYQVEYTLDDLTNNPSFSNISGVIAATGAVSRTTVTNGLLTPKAHYRVRLVE